MKSLLTTTVERVPAGTVIQTRRGDEIDMDVILTPTTQHLAWFVAKCVAEDVKRAINVVLCAEAIRQQASCERKNRLSKKAKDSERQ